MPVIEAKVVKELPCGRKIGELANFCGEKNIIMIFSTY